MSTTSGLLTLCSGTLLYAALIDNTLVCYLSEQQLSDRARPFLEIHQPSSCVPLPNNRFAILSEYDTQEHVFTVKDSSEVERWKCAIEGIQSTQVYDRGNEWFVGVVSGRERFVKVYARIEQEMLVFYKHRFFAEKLVDGHDDFMVNHLELDIVPGNVFGLEHVVKVRGNGRSMYVKFFTDAFKDSCVQALMAQGACLQRISLPFENQSKYASAFANVNTKSDLIVNVKDLPSEIVVQILELPDNRLVLKGRAKICFLREKKVRERYLFLTSSTLILCKEYDKKLNLLKFKEQVPMNLLTLHASIPQSLFSHTEFRKGFSILLANIEAREFNGIAFTFQDYETKRIWERSLSEVVFENILKSDISNVTEDAGWQYSFLKGTLHSCAKAGDLYTIDECIEESKEKKFSDVHEPFSLSTPLHLACYSGNLGILKKLILSEMDYRARDINGNEPIHYACIGLHFDIIDYILTTIGPKAACQVSNSLNSSFDPPLAVIMFSTHAAGRDASRESIVKCMEILIRHGADINFVNLETRLNYIHRAAGHNFSESIDVLCKSNCDVMAKDPSGDTPLHIAVKLLAEDSIKSLLDHGAFPNIFNREGKRPIQCIPNIPVASMPTAISLISGGARIQLNELPDHLQSNFDALQKYEKECQETFVEVVSEGKARNFKWIEDNSSKVCLACGAEFTMFVRRHHCRHCGILSCGACSSRAYRNPGSDSLRCCDSCYNMLKRMHQKDQKKPLPPIPSITSEESNSAKSKQQKSLPSIPKSSNRSLSTNSMVSSSKDSKKSTNPSSSDTSKVLNETKQRLQNRGEKLSQLEEKSSQLENNASDFANLARQLRQKQEKSWF